MIKLRWGDIWEGQPEKVQNLDLLGVEIGVEIDVVDGNKFWLVVVDWLACFHASAEIAPFQQIFHAAFTM